MSTPLTLQEAADELGVHYMTAYRYVRLGLLDAAKVGGSWQVQPEAIDRFRDGADNAPVERGDRAPWADRLEARLVAGDSRGAWGVVEAALAAGSDLNAIYVDVLSPAMVSIGGRWERGELDVAIEHRASGIAMRIMGRLGHRFARRGRVRGSIIVGAPAGEHHSLPGAILSDLLRLRGWDVSDLGADVPAASFVYALRANPDVRAVGLSVTNPAHLDSLASACAAIRDAGVDVKIVVGGRAIESADHAIGLGADGMAVSGDTMHELLDEWLRERQSEESRPSPTRS
jgi:excisionase family DNA binding protein